MSLRGKLRRYLAGALWLAIALPGSAGCSPAQNSGPERDKWQRPAEVMAELGVRSGSVVADIGCGRGYFSFELANRVGPQGKVYAEDIKDDVLGDVRRGAKKQGLKQIETVLGAPDDPHLPANTLDVALTMNSFHEWREYDDMLRHVYDALKPGGLFGDIDGAAEPGQPRTTYYDEHRMPEEMERADITRHGFQFLRRERGFTQPDDGKVFYFLIFVKPGPVSHGPAQQQTPEAASGVDASSAATASQAEKQRLSINPVTGQVSASASAFTPLTANERWKLYFTQSYWSVGAYVGPFFAALALDQSRNDPREWGGGFRGYGRRVASRVAGGDIIQNSFQHPVAALLKEDVRYIASSQHGFKRRAGHAVLYSFLTYNNEGHPTLNVSNIGGYYFASAASTLWLPGRRNVAAYTLSDGSEALALSTLVNLLQEFWPEIHHDVFRRPTP